MKRNDPFPIHPYHLLKFIKVSEESVSGNKKKEEGSIYIYIYRERERFKKILWCKKVALANKVNFTGSPLYEDFLSIIWHSSLYFASWCLNKYWFDCMYLYMEMEFST